MAGVELPAICDQCGTAYPSGMGVALGYVETQRSMNAATPCPECGGAGTIPRGAFEAVEGTASILRLLADRPADLAAVRSAVEFELQTPEPDLDRLERRLEAEVPEALGLMDVLRDPATQNVIGILAVLATALSAIR